MKDIKPIRGNVILRKLIAQGEHEHQDFKYSVSDAPKIARSISAFANCDGGRLIIGVRDNGSIAGVRNDEDIYVVELAANRYCSPPQQVVFEAYRIDGMQVIVASVDAAENRPVYAVDVDGKHRAFFRVADENIAAHPLMVRAWKQQADDNPAVFDPSGSLAQVARRLSELGTLSDTQRLALDLHISRAAAEDALVRLIATGLARFRYIGTQFVIIPAEI